jgi:hypothetical protein
VGLTGFEPITKQLWVKENLFILYIESKGILATLARLSANDWVVITEDNHVDKIPEENFDKIITLVEVLVRLYIVLFLYYSFITPYYFY